MRPARSLSRAPLVLLTMLALAGPAPAALDAQLKKPYQVQVVLQVADNRALTPLFQDDLQRALGDHLRQAFGALARVEVVREHPLLGEIASRGLESALEGWDHTSEVQTHFVLLEYAGGEYRLQAGVHDGMTNRAGVRVRRLQSGDRALVPLLAARLVERNFAPVGTATATGGDGKSAVLTLKGGGLGVAMDRWVKAGDVFAVSQLTPQGAAAHAAAVPWALLEVLDGPRDGVCRCRYFRRLRGYDLRDAPGTLGYRAVRVSATQAPVRLRFVDEDSGQPIDGLEVQIFRPDMKEAVKMTTGRDGVVAPREPFNRLAIAYLPRGEVLIPVEVVAGRTVLCRVKLKGGSEVLAALEYRRDAWLRRLYDDLQLAGRRVRDLNEKLGESLQAAEAEARSVLENFSEELDYLKREYADLRDQAKLHKLAAKQFNLADGAQRLAELSRRREKLKEFIGDVEAAIKKDEQAKELARVVQRARLLEADADYAAAIALYEKVLKERADETNLRAHLEELRRGWAVRDKKHAEARTFAYETWPKLDVAGLKKELPTARQVVATLQEAGDRLTARKMMLAEPALAAALKKELDRLRQRDTEDNRSQAKVIGQLAADLEHLHAELTAFVRGQKGSP